MSELEDLHEFEEDSNADSDSDESSVDSDKPDKIMSMFSSYYGMEVEEEETPEEDQDAGAMQIDSPNFNANVYVKDLLLQKNGTDLIAEDTRMIHEIRSLDSDMQMLVYENYNKFISATETIKRMKNNVEAMEEDMVSVRVKTMNLSDNAVQLDKNLHEKRAEVDKLVKVRKLLHKLEFLSELPEKLSRMIQQEKYKEAVELYNRTISVLMKHSNVLSFRNIQARTEQMMKDLRVMVTGLLDNSSALEVVKLTQYVTTLRLMEAPKRQVIDKFIMAHKERWTLLVTKYEKEALGCESMPPLGSVKPICMLDSDGHSSGSVKRPKMLEVRQFHQTIVSGLMEACKGVKEMFQQNAGLNTSIQLDSQRPEGEGDDVTGATAAIAGAQQAEEQEAKRAHEELQKMIRGIMVIYSNAIVVSLQRFFTEYNQFLRVNAHLATAEFQIENKLASTCGAAVTSSHPTPSSAPEVEGGTPGVSTAEKVITHDIYAAIEVYKQQLSDWNDERNNWVMLLRQMILEVQCVDESVEDCRCFPHTSDSPSVGEETNINVGVVVPNIYEHSACYSQLVVELVVDGLNASWFNYYVDMYVRIFSTALPQFLLLCYLKTELGSNFPTLLDTSVKSSSVATVGSPRNQISDRSLIAQQWQTVLGDAFFSCFSLLCVDAKPIFDIMNVLQPDICAIKPSLTSIDTMLYKYLNGGAGVATAGTTNSMSRAVSTTGTGTYDAAFEEQKCKGTATLLFGHQLRDVSGFTVQFCRAISFRLERLCGLSSRKTVTYLGSPVTEDTGGDWDCDIYEELYTHHTSIVTPVAPEILVADGERSPKVKDDDADFYDRINNEITKKNEKAERDLKKKNDSAGTGAGADCDTSLEDCRRIAAVCGYNALVAHFILSKISSQQSVSGRMCENLAAVDCPVPRTGGVLLQKCTDYITFSSRRLLIFYNESCVQYTNALMGTHVMYMHNKVMEKTIENLTVIGLEEEDWTARAESFHRGEVAVSNSALAMISALDMIAQFNCVMFDDTPPVVKSAPIIDRGGDRDGRVATRKSMAPNAAAAAQMRLNQQNQLNKSTMGLQQDIDRLFSEKILICNYDSVVSNPGNTTVLSVIAKVILKAFQEHMRTVHFHSNSNDSGAFSTASNSGYVMLQLQVDLLFLKQAYMYLLKDTAETDRLVEQCLSALTSRCCTHTRAAEEEDYSMVNMLENVNGSSELNRAVSEAVFKLSKKCVLVSR